MEDDKAQPRRTRIDVRNDATLIFTDGSEVGVTVFDLSEHGFRLQSDEILEVGETIRLRDRNGEMRAEIRWVTGFEAGGRFLSRVPDLG